MDTSKTGNPGQERPRGAIRSPAARVLAAPRRIARSTPAYWGIVPSLLSYWGNSQYGDCVAAEEMLAKAVSSLVARRPELAIAEAAAIAWAAEHGYLDGAALTDVMDTMASTGIVVDGVTYTDGPYSTVDWTDGPTLRSAIFTGPVKLGVAADQLEGVVGGSNGWLLQGAERDDNMDHCIALIGFGTIAQCYQILNLAPPALYLKTDPAALAFTWDTVGVIDLVSVSAITSEAYVRSPTTPQFGSPTPGPTPTPTPTPIIPTPTPPPGRSGTLVDTRGRVLYLSAGQAARPAAGINAELASWHQAGGFWSVPRGWTVVNP